MSNPAMISSQNMLKLTAKNFPFETQISQDPLIEDRQFSPWVRKKTAKIIQMQHQVEQSHKFLEKINISPKQKKRGLLQNGFDGSLKLEEIRADLEQKIRAEKIQNQDNIEILKNNRRAIESKGFFQRRAGLSRLYRKPRSIDLSLNCDSKQVLRCAPYSSSSKPTNYDYHQSKKESYLIRKAKNKKNSGGQKQFSQTMNNFRKDFKGIDIIQTQKKFYKTLQLKISPIQNASKTFREKQERASSSFQKNTSLSTRTKFPLKNEKVANMEQQQRSIMTCQGKHLITGTPRTRGQKIRHINFQTKDLGETIFLK